MLRHVQMEIHLIHQFVVGIRYIQGKVMLIGAYLKRKQIVPVKLMIITTLCLVYYYMVEGYMDQVTLNTQIIILRKNARIKLNLYLVLEMLDGHGIVCNTMIQKQKQRLSHI